MTQPVVRLAHPAIPVNKGARRPPGAMRAHPHRNPLSAIRAGSAQRGWWKVLQRPMPTA